MPSDYDRIAAAIHFLDQHLDQQPDLNAVAEAVSLSPFHLQRLFQRWAGVSPKRFQQFLTVEYAKQLLAQSGSVLDASLATGLSGPSRLHDHFVTLEAVTPGDYKRKGLDLDIRYGVHPSPFGPMLLAVTDRGVIWLAFVADAATETTELARLRATWSEARIVADPAATAPTARRIFAREPAAAPLAALVKGSNFRIQVWKALLQIPPGAVRAYEHIAAAIGRPAACRAVGQAVAANPVGYLIPCHRVIRGVGLPGGYRWGAARKRALLAWEAARAWGETDVA